MFQAKTYAHEVAQEARNAELALAGFKSVRDHLEDAKVYAVEMLGKDEAVDVVASLDDAISNANCRIEALFPQAAE